MSHRATVYVYSGEPSQPGDCDVYWTTSHHAAPGDHPPASPCRLSTWAQCDWDELTEIDCIFPAEWITTLAVKLPTARKSIQRAALPYAIEEFLILPLERYHIAPVSTEPDTSMGVAVMEAVLMDTWCRWIDQHFARVKTRFLVDGWLLPRTDSETAVLQLDNRILIRYGDRLCCATDSAMRDTVMDSLHSTYPDAGPPHTVTPPDLGAASGDVEVLVTALMARVGQYQGPDLRQGRYKSQTVLDWRFPAGALVASVLLSTAVLTASNYYKASTYDAERRDIESETEQQYRETFSAQGQVVNMPAQARQHLMKLKAEWHPPEERPPAFFPLFNAVTQILAVWGQEYTNSLRQLAYVESDSAINLDLMTSEMGHINRLQKSFTDQGLEASVLSASEEEGQFVGRMKVRHETQ